MNSPYIPVRTETCTFIVLKPFPPPTPFPPAKLPRFYAKTLYGNNFPINRARYVNLIVNFTRVTSSLRVMHQPITLGRDNAFAICRAAGGDDTIGIEELRILSFALEASTGSQSHR